MREAAILALSLWIWVRESKRGEKAGLTQEADGISCVQGGKGPLRGRPEQGAVIVLETGN